MAGVVCLLCPLRDVLIRGEGGGGQSHPIKHLYGLSVTHHVIHLIVKVLSRLNFYLLRQNLGPVWTFLTFTTTKIITKYHNNKIRDCERQNIIFFEKYMRDIYSL